MLFKTCLSFELSIFVVFLIVVVVIFVEFLLFELCFCFVEASVVVLAASYIEALLVEVVAKGVVEGAVL
jgi:hypothetical protein